MRRAWTPFLAFLVIAALQACASAGPSTDAALAAIRAVGPEGAGHEEASRAWRELVARGPVAILPILAAFDECFMFLGMVTLASVIVAWFMKPGDEVPQAARNVPPPI